MKKVFKPSHVTLVFIVISAIVTFFYLWKAGQEIWLSRILDKRTEAHITQWQIDEESKSGKYIIGVFYEYFVDGIKHEGKTIFSKEKFLNYYAAIDAITKLSKMKLDVSYCSNDVHFSKIDHHFKIKDTIYFAISSTVLFYFFILRRGVKKFE